MKIKIIDRGYGCFQTKGVCEICGKTNRAFEFSYSTNHIAIGDKEKIKEVVEEKFLKGEHFYCIKCGNRILEVGKHNE